jgi:hypothetical protein
MTNTISWTAKTRGWNWISNDRRFEILRDYTPRGHVVFVVWRIRPNHEIVDKCSTLQSAKQAAQDADKLAEMKRYSDAAKALALHGLGGKA